MSGARSLPALRSKPLRVNDFGASSRFFLTHVQSKCLQILLNFSKKLLRHFHTFVAALRWRYFHRIHYSTSQLILFLLCFLLASLSALITPNVYHLVFGIILTVARQNWVWHERVISLFMKKIITKKFCVETRNAVNDPIFNWLRNNLEQCGIVMGKVMVHDVVGILVLVLLLNWIEVMF